VNRGKEFDEFYIYQPLLQACCQVIGQPFKLSTMHARNLHSNSQAQELHIDFKPGEERFPLVSFIVMVDEFCDDNGATRFVPGSHKWSAISDKLTADALADYENQTVRACGQAGSMIIFSGSVWHGFSANTTPSPRRSIQGAFIPRNAQAATDFSFRMTSETLARISPLAKYLLAI
jgi:ectoine hydroxylase-related dioxygenase (phytanoyl-CoA dioxygenase family)